MILIRVHDVTVFSETLTGNQAYLERIMLGLRRAQGLDMNDLMKDLN